MSKNSCLYKYTKLEYVESILRNGLYASPVDCLNDPYEYKEIKDPDSYRVVCLTRSANAKLMWSHYADSHKGCSIQIALPEGYGDSDFVLRDVTYSSLKKKRKDFSTEDIVSSLYIKDKKWSYEHETRAVCHTEQFDPRNWQWSEQTDDIGKRKKLFFIAKIKAINFGCMVNTESSEYYTLLQKIETYNHTHKSKEHIKVQKYKMADDRFAFILDKNYDYLKEIERLKPKEPLFC